jgi:hypothetical protein
MITPFACPGDKCSLGVQLSAVFATSALLCDALIRAQPLVNSYMSRLHIVTAMASMSEP